MDDVIVIADRDTYISKQLPYQNFGGSTELGTAYGLWPAFVYDKRAFLHFPIPETPIGKAIGYATLYLYVEEAQGSIKNLYAPTVDWGEYSLTWINQPSLGQIADDHFVDDSVGWKAIDIIDFVNGWLTNKWIIYPYEEVPFPNYGIILAKGGYNIISTYISSREKVGFEPYINIHYVSEGPGGGYLGYSYIID